MKRSARARRSMILLVDDEQESLDLLQRTLRGGHETVTATNGGAALGCLERHPIAVVIADQRMPGMTGVEFLALASERFPYVQRILLTAYAEVEGLIEAINAGHVFAYLAKPWHPEDLLATVRRAVETHDLMCEKDRLLRDLEQKNRKLEALVRETRRLHEAKIQAERWSTLGKLAGMVAHDLRSPLTAIRCQAGILGSEEASLEARERSARAILEQAARMRDYVDELLLFAAPRSRDSGRQLYDVTALVTSLREAFAQRCQRKGVRFHLELACRDSICIRPSEVYRVLANLVENALEEVGEGGEILVATVARAKEIEIRVADSGPGIPESIRSDLFEPFATYGKPGGTGLGLAIVKKIVTEHGGRVWEEPWLLRGACFHVVLPRGPC